MELAFVTGNKGKLEEARARLAEVGVDVVQADLAPVEIQADTLQEVARAKAEDVARRLDGAFFLDDAGLFVDALNGFPGVYSAHALRTLGVPGLLKLLDGVADRAARFEAVVAYREPGAPLALFTGVARGRIAETPRSGGHGFGFDPVFVPEGREETFAELDTATKNRLSHRGRALDQLVRHLAERA